MKIVKSKDDLFAFMAENVDSFNVNNFISTLRSICYLKRTFGAAVDEGFVNKTFMVAICSCLKYSYSLKRAEIVSLADIDDNLAEKEYIIISSKEFTLIPIDHELFFRGEGVYFDLDLVQLYNEWKKDNE